MIFITKSFLINRTSRYIQLERDMRFLLILEKQLYSDKSDVLWQKTFLHTLS